MAGRVFHRNASLTLARPRGTGADSYFTQDANAVVITELRMVGRIEKHLHAEPNTCTIDIYNLADATRAAIERKPLHIRFEAGYDGEFKRIFTGDLRRGWTTTEGPDRVTHLEIADGDRAYNHARVGRSFRAGVDKRTAVKEIARSMGLKVPTSIEEARELADQFASGLTLQGPSQRELTRVLRSAGMSWSVQNGSLQILRNTDVRADQAIVISEDTGMIGSPDYGPPKKPGATAMLTAVVLLKPELTPGGRVLVDSRDIKRGLFRVERLIHVLDTDPRGPWQTEIEAKPL